MTESATVEHGWEFLSALWSVWLELAPWLLFGAAVAGAMHVLLPENLISRRLQGRWAPFWSVLLGIPLPLCSCGVIPAAVGLKREGASDGAVTGFLIATPQTGVDSFFVSASMLGWPFALFKVVAAMLMGLWGGYWVDMRPSSKESVGLAMSHEHSHGVDAKPKWKKALLHGVDLIDSIANWLVIGVVVSVLITILVPPSAFETVRGWGVLATAAAALTFSVPMYVCSTASVPIAAALVANGMPMSAALIFLLAGPATNVATIAAIYKTIGGRALWIYLFSIVAGSVLLGIWMDRSGWMPVMDIQLHEHGSHSNWFVQLCGLLLLFIVVRNLWEQLRSLRRRWSVNQKQSIIIPVEGMTCDGCARGLERKLLALEGVEEASVDYASHSATVNGEASMERIRAIIADAGFRVVESAHSHKNVDLPG